jgi:hypothetical protein
MELIIWAVILEITWCRTILKKTQNPRFYQKNKPYLFSPWAILALRMHLETAHKTKENWIYILFLTNNYYRCIRNWNWVCFMFPKACKTVLHLCRQVLFYQKNPLTYRLPKQQMTGFGSQEILEVKKVRVLTSFGLYKVHKVVVSITNLHLVPRLSMHSIHFKWVGECVSRWVIEHASHDKVLELGAST